MKDYTVNDFSKLTKAELQDLAMRLLRDVEQPQTIDSNEKLRKPQKPRVLHKQAEDINITEGAMHTFIIDGVVVEYKVKDQQSKEYQHKEYLDAGDPGEIQVKEPSELGESLKELNDDKVQPGTRMSGIDLRSRLHYVEVPSILAVDSLVGFKVLPLEILDFTRKKLRLSVSLNGAGRSDIVNVVAGKNEADARKASGGLDKIRGWFGGGNNEEIRQ